MIRPQTLKGFRDFLPSEARKRQYAIDILKKVFESYGFEPLETPALEYEEVLLGKYGDEGDKLMYRFTDRGDRKVALRYDQTVPLARVVAQYQNELPMPFKRYQIQNVWRADNTQKGRFREFMQCDIDTVGTNSLLADAEIIEVTSASLKALGFKDFKILINDRKTFSQLNKQGFVTDKDLVKAIRSLDKIKKIGEKGILEDLQKNGFSKEISKAIVENAKKLKESDDILLISKILEQLGLRKSEEFIFVPELARGLDYYTGLIFEVEIKDYDVGSVCGGGRYDNLIGMFAGKQIPAVGCAFGFDRLIEAMDALNLFPKDLQTTKVLVTVFSKELLDKSIAVCEILSKNGINQELYLDTESKLEKQLKYADKKGIPYAIIIGPNEASKNMVTLRNMKTREQKTVSLEEVLPILNK
ncbi:MAG: histidine--tRNA ligase [Candidatus Levybacteria bacterium RIFCSPLOWO2_01_FULL_37_26]|nr:MAG: histidine--tRNA ligase [Candidatus Levybacteria bacterium RIFCSPHIGHO2_12_FULL_37_9]OGH39489.1 MAG: histidine--tRNA ligase [Candidatus Levybacteria bacterium RIFCSPLOWO2_01_FULL_37_26]